MRGCNRVACLCAYPFVFLSLVLTSLPVHAQQAGVVDSWRRSKITLSFQHLSLSAIAGELADRTGKSIVIEGEPELAGFDLNKTDTTESLLNEIGNAFDYSWRLSKSGVLLFNKRFHNRSEYPQIVEPELRESITDMKAVMQSLPVSSSLSVSIQAQMILLARSLSPQQLEALKQGRKLRIASLSEGQRVIAEQAIFTDMFRDVWQRWNLLDEQLAALKEATLQNDLVPIVDPSSPRNKTNARLLLRYGSIGDKTWGLLQQVIANDDLNTAAADKEDTGTVGREAANPLRGVTTLGQAVRALSNKTGTPLEVAPSLAERRLIVQFRQITAAQAMNAFAELEDWIWRSPASGPPVLSRPRRLSCSSVEEVRLALCAALPADIRRFLTGRPAFTDKEIIMPRGLAVYESFENSQRVGYKITEQAQKMALKFYLSLGPQSLRRKTIPCSQLSPAQRAKIALLLTMQACAASAIGFTSSFDKPTTYESNPADAYLMFHGFSTESNSIEILIGGDISATQRGGAFGTPILLDTLSAPDYKMQRPPARP